MQFQIIKAVAVIATLDLFLDYAHLRFFLNVVFVNLPTLGPFFFLSFGFLKVKVGQNLKRQDCPNLSSSLSLFLGQKPVAVWTPPLNAIKSLNVRKGFQLRSQCRQNSCDCHYLRTKSYPQVKNSKAMVETWKPTVRKLEYTLLGEEGNNNFAIG